MLLLALAASITSADLQQWIDDQPQVRAYEAQRAALGVQPPAPDSFRQPPQLPREAACQAREGALTAAVALFKVNDAPHITLTEPELQAKNGGEATFVLNDAGKKAVSDRAQAYEQDAGRFAPACLG